MASSVRVELKVTANIPFGNSGSGLGGAFPFHALTLENPPWKDWRPGQFVMMRAQWGSDGAECARALPICRVTPQGLVLFFRNDEKTSRHLLDDCCGVFLVEVARDDLGSLGSRDIEILADCEDKTVSQLSFSGSSSSDNKDITRF